MSNTLGGKPVVQELNLFTVMQVQKMVPLAVVSLENKNAPYENR